MVIYSCGGGGSSSGTSGSSGSTSISTQPVTSQTEVLNATSSLINQFSQIANLFSESVTGLNNLGPRQQSTNYIQGQVDINLAKVFLNNMRKNLGKLKAQGSDSGTEHCDNGGTLTYKFNWTNPSCIDGTQDACWKNNTITFEETYNNCEMYGVIGNGSGKGQVTFDANGNPNGYVEIPASFTISSKYSNKSFTFKNSFKYEYSFKYTSSQEQSYVNYKSGTIETSNLTMNFNNFSYQYTGENFDPYGDPLKTTNVFNGKISGKLNNRDFEYAAQNLKLYNETKGNTDYSSVDGFLYEGFCNKKWYEFKTVSPIITSISQQCPSSGKLSINNSYALEATSTGGLKIIDSTGEVKKQYQSCKEYEKEAKGMICQ